MTLDEMKALSYGQRVWFKAADGTARGIKINGAPRTWKRDSARVYVPLKYGMYQFSYSERDKTCKPEDRPYGERLLVPVNELPVFP
jgi:hypothetical protein